MKISYHTLKRTVPNVRNATDNEKSLEDCSTKEQELKFKSLSLKIDHETGAPPSSYVNVQVGVCLCVFVVFVWMMFSRHYVHTRTSKRPFPSFYREIVNSWWVIFIFEYCFIFLSFSSEDESTWVWRWGRWSFQSESMVLCVCGKEIILSFSMLLHKIAQKTTENLLTHFSEENI